MRLSVFDSFVVSAVIFAVVSLAGTNTISLAMFDGRRDAVRRDKLR
jgi:hypothetical protein